MVRLTRLMGLGILGLTLVVGVGVSGDKKDPKEKTPSLPPGWKALKLSKDQLAKVHGIMSDYKSKIDEHQKMIGDLKAQEKADMIKVLTDEQKAQYLRGLTGEDKTPPKDKAPPKDTAVKDKVEKDK